MTFRVIITDKTCLHSSSLVRSFTYTVTCYCYYIFVPTCYLTTISYCLSLSCVCLPFISFIENTRQRVLFSTLFITGACLTCFYSRRTVNCLISPLIPSSLQTYALNIKNLLPQAWKSALQSVKLALWWWTAAATMDFSCKIHTLFRKY